MTPIFQTLLLVASTASSTPPRLDSTCGVGWKVSDLSVGASAKGHLVAIRGIDGFLKTIEWDSTTRKWSSWNEIPSQSLAYSAPWVQAPVNIDGVGLTNNIFALNYLEGHIRTSQWIRESAGGFQTSIGIGESDSIWFRPVTAHLGPVGQQALFAVFRDSCLKMRVWDSLQRTWGPWSNMGIKTALPPTANQVGPNDVNIYVTMPNGSIRQNWWTQSAWSGWVVPAYSGAASEAPSVNINWYDHLLFSFDAQGKPQVRYWNGSSWTGWSPLNFPVKRSLNPVVAGSDSVLLYGLDSANQVVRIGWRKGGSWSVPETLGLVPCPRVKRDMGSRILSAAKTTEGILLAIRGANDSLFTLQLGTGKDSARCWSSLSGQPALLSNPWLQATAGGVNNLYVLGESNGVPRTFQWIYDHGTFQTTIGIGESDSVVSLASGRLDDSGRQVLIAVFQDSSVHQRIWDSVSRTWSGCSDMGQKSTRSPDVVQTFPNELNLYTIGLDGRVDQTWWYGTNWSVWVVPSYDSIISGASSINFDNPNHVLFGIGPDSFLVERTWNGSSWTGWHRLPWKPVGEVAPVVVDGLLELFFVSRDGYVMRATRRFGTAWSEASVIARKPPTTTCLIVHEPVTAGVKIRHASPVRSGMLALPQELIGYQGAIQFVGLDGKVVASTKAAGVRELSVPGRGISFVKLGA
ncbi:MAG: hypothetical protein AAB214_14255, partial [Fibrobacterota bacterium]